MIGSVLCMSSHTAKTEVSPWRLPHVVKLDAVEDAREYGVNCDCHWVLNVIPDTVIDVWRVDFKIELLD